MKIGLIGLDSPRIPDARTHGIHLVINQVGQVVLVLVVGEVWLLGLILLLLILHTGINSYYCFGGFINIIIIFINKISNK